MAEQADNTQLIASETISDSKVRIPKACEECRRRKQRCDGLTPCNVCSRRGSPCRYRSFLRNRATKALLAQRRNRKRSSQAATSGSDDTEAQNTPEQRESASPDDGNGIVPLRECIFNSVRATYAAPESPSSLLQLYYGPSSNFSFLQHIHSHLKERRASQPVSDDNDGNAGIDKFKYKGIVFGGVASKGPTASPVFLRYELAKSFLQNYLSATHHFFPLLDPDRLCFTFERLYGSRRKQDPIEPLDKAAVIIAMAMGAISTQEEEWRERLLTQARTETESVRYHVNVRAVQVAALMAHCEFATGHPNLAYLSLGTAVTKALAAGIHKRGRGSERPEANWTMWNLFCNESISCLMFGRPYLLHRETIDIPLPGRPSFMAAQIELCTIIRHTHQMYFHYDKSTVADLVDSAHEIRHELESFSSMIKQDIGVWIGGPTCPIDAEKLTWHVVTNYLYFYTMLLAFRPLLLLQIELKRYVELQIDGHSRPNTGRYQMPALLNGQEQYCIDAARSIISLSESVLFTVPSAQGLCNHGYFLESACFVLVLAAVHANHSVATSYIQDITRGLASLRILVQREPIPSVVAALERMLGKLSVRTVLSKDSTIPHVQQQDMMDVQPLPVVTSQVRSTEMLPDLLAEQSGVPQDGLWGTLNQGVLDDVGHNGILENLELPDMDWGIDFSLLDVEEFVSVMGVQPGFSNTQ